MAALVFENLERYVLEHAVAEGRFVEQSAQVRKVAHGHRQELFEEQG